jgi:hypothetical protein
VRKAVTALLSVWTRVDADMSGDNQNRAIDAFSRLARLEPLPETAPDAPVVVWGPASQFAASGAIRARVKPDAPSVDDENRWMYANRVGEIMSLRRGILTISFLDERDGAPQGFSGTVREFDVDITHLVKLPEA